LRETALQNSFLSKIEECLSISKLQNPFLSRKMKIPYLYIKSTAVASEN